MAPPGSLYGVPWVDRTLHCKGPQHGLLQLLARSLVPQNTVLLRVGLLPCALLQTLAPVITAFALERLILDTHVSTLRLRKTTKA